MSETSIERLTRATKKDYESLQKLLVQLSERASFSMEEFEEIVGDKNVHLFVARDEGKIIGTGMLVETPVFVERRGVVEDVVVDESYRGKGIGKQLIEYVVLAARGKGLDAIQLTSSSKRGAANTLYRKLGFKQKETNVYRMEL